jgi:hypothetical protein
MGLACRHHSSLCTQAQTCPASNLSQQLHCRAVKHTLAARCVLQAHAIAVGYACVVPTWKAPSTCCVTCSTCSKCPAAVSNHCRATHQATSILAVASCHPIVQGRLLCLLTCSSDWGPVLRTQLWQACCWRADVHQLTSPPMAPAADIRGCRPDDMSWP